MSLSPVSQSQFAGSVVPNKEPIRPRSLLGCLVPKLVATATSLVPQQIGYYSRPWATNLPI